MSVTDADELVRRLEVLEDSQESIAGSADWVLAQLGNIKMLARSWHGWMLKPGLEPRRMLLGIYLLNHVVQQAKSRRDNRFQEAFGEVIVEVLNRVHKTFPPELQRKLVRVCKIWSERRVFSPAVIQQVDQVMAVSQGSHSTSDVGSSHANSGSFSGNNNLGNIPRRLKPLATNFGALERLHHNVRALKIRFDATAQELDTSSVVYERNYQTLSKIGLSTKESIEKAIALRQDLIKSLKTLIEEQVKDLEMDKTSNNEIEFILESKSPETALKGDVHYDELPAYEMSAPEDESSSKSASSDDEDNRKDRQSNIASIAKRQSDSFEESPTKRSHPSESQTNKKDDPPKGVGVTSSIQDLLSKLAS